MGLIEQKAYPGAVLCTVALPQKTLRVLFGAPPEVSRRLKADQKAGPDGKPVINFPDVVVCPPRRVVDDTPTLCPEFIFFAAAFLGGRFDWATQAMKEPIRWVGKQDELDDLQVVMKECFLGVDERELRTRVRSNRAVREMLLNDQKFFAVKDANGVPHPLHHYCAWIPLEGSRALLAEGVEVVAHPDGSFDLVAQGETSRVVIDYAGVDIPVWADRYPTPAEPMRPSAFGLAVLGSDSAFSTNGPTTTNLLSLGGEFFLWDCSPFTAWMLTRLGISIGDVRGIFVSHIHDDHVVDLYKFAWNGYRRMEIITTPEVREQVLRKFSALWGVTRDAVDAAFEWRLVRVHKPFLINGVTVSLHYGAHPIPSLGGRFEFRGHTFGMTGDSSSRGGPVGLDKQLESGLIAPERHKFLVDFPGEQFTLCDAGEATIHGFVKDFEVYDPQNIRLAHRSDIPPPFNESLKLAGPLFERCLVPGNQAVMDAAVVSEVITSLGTRLHNWVNRFLQANEARVLPAGEAVVKQGDAQPDFVYLVLAGTAEVIRDGQRVALLERGSLFGEEAFLRSAARNATVRSLGPLRLLPVPGNLFMEFIREDAEATQEASRAPRASVKDRLERVYANRGLVAEAFGGKLAAHCVHALAGQAKVIEVRAGQPVATQGWPDEVMVVVRGQIEELAGSSVLLAEGDLLGGELPNGGPHKRLIPAVARVDSTLLQLPARELYWRVETTPSLRKQVEDSLARHGRKLRLARDAGSTPRAPHGTTNANR